MATASWRKIFLKNVLTSIPTNRYVVYQLVGTLMKAPQISHESKTRLLNAALHVIRAKGYSAARIEDICEPPASPKEASSITSMSKEELALAAADHWNSAPGPSSHPLPINSSPTPRPPAGLCRFPQGPPPGRAARLHLPRRHHGAGSLRDHPPSAKPATEVSASTPQRSAGHRRSHAPAASRGVDRGSLALYTQAAIQGAFILAKAKEDPDVAAACLDHLHRYIEMLFNRPGSQRSRTDPPPKRRTDAASAGRTELIRM